MQPQISHQAMGYDRTSTMFSPDGRLLQVEYAKKTVKQGTSAVGIVCKDGVILVADKRVVEKLIVPESVEKIFQVDSHIAAAASGIVSDGRILVERAQLVAQQHRVTFDSSIDVQSIVKDICNLKQQFTQFGGARPFGVSILFGGIDENGNGGTPRLFLTDPTGIYFEYKATAIGENESEIKETLEREYKEGMSVQDGIKLAVKSLKKALDKDFDIDRLDGAYVMSKDGKFTVISKEMFSKAR
ncbi:MAG: archaeal proteasome endopeptidase complex subunit alpha [Candidatus Woesearchaeota archaeon]